MRRETNREGTGFIYGRWPIREALESGQVTRLLVAKGANGDPIEEIIKLAQAKCVPCDWMDRRKLNHISGTDTHQGVLAHVTPFQFSDLDDIWKTAVKSKSNGPRVLFLDGIMDPQNLGSLLRSAVFFGVPGVVIPKWRAASVSASVVRASAGAARLIPIAQVSNLATAVSQAKKTGLWVVGADTDGQNAKNIDLPRPFALVLGSEGEGLHALIRKRCDVIVGIGRAQGPHAVGSLNVGVAGGILLHQFS